MSARVANPFAVSEMRRLARPFAPSAQARARVCRSLWGSAGQEDSRAFAAREMAEQRERAAERWGFDFLREVPRARGEPGAHRFKWFKVTRDKIKSVPAPYRVPRLAPSNFSLEAVLETARATVPSVPAREPQGSEAAAPLVAEAVTVPPAMASPDAASTSTSSSTSSCSTGASSRRQAQSHMTDFFRQKRSRQVEEVRSTKKARTLPSTSLPEQNTA